MANFLLLQIDEFGVAAAREDGVAGVDAASLLSRSSRF